MASDKTLRSVMPHDPPTAREMFFAHGITERTNDPSIIMPTVTSWDQNFAVLDPEPDGGLSLATYGTTDEVTKFYVDRTNSEKLTGAHPISLVTSPWWALTDVVGEYDMITTGEHTSPHVVVLFATWTDGIVGEIIWTEPEWANIPDDWRYQADLGRKLGEMEAGWRANDLSARVAPFEQNARGAIRIVEADGDRRQRFVAQSRGELEAAWAAPEYGRVVELERQATLVTHFYAFAAWRMILEVGDGLVERETAAIFPVGPNDGFAAELSYSFETRL